MGAFGFKVVRTAKGCTRSMAHRIYSPTLAAGYVTHAQDYAGRRSRQSKQKFTYTLGINVNRRIAGLLRPRQEPFDKAEGDG